MGLKKITNLRFGHLVALDGYKIIFNRTYWKFKCDCGKELFILKDNVIRGKSESCGCQRWEDRNKKNDISGKKYNRLTALEVVRITKLKVYWSFLCDCGKITELTKTQAVKGLVKSCGCLRTERIREAKKLLRLDPTEVAFNRLCYLYINGANKRGYSFELNKDQIRILTKSNCFYCGEIPKQVVNIRDKYYYTYNGIDRKDNMLGYTVDNTVSCCKNCNMAKGQLSEIDFLNWIKKAYGHNFKT